MSEPIWIVGGEQRSVSHWTKEWKLYKLALVARAENGDVRRVLEYESPPQHCCDEAPSIVFKAGSIKDGRAYLCTQTEVLICDFPSFAIKEVISLPCFNDIHHVSLGPDGRLYVVVTGLDAVAELAPDGKLLQLTSVVGGSVWDRFSQTADYRKVPTTKPHLAHPNFVFFLDGEPWVTRFEQRDAIPLRGPNNNRPIFRLGPEGVHDGHIVGDQIYFTAVNGVIWRFDLISGLRQSFNLNTLGNIHGDRPLGWCRGILPIGDECWVGFSRIRFTTLRQNLNWIRSGFRRVELDPPAPTRVARYNLASGLLINEIDVESVGMNTIFSIHG